MASTRPGGALPRPTSTPAIRIDVGRRRQVDVVAGAHRRHDDARARGRSCGAGPAPGRAGRRRCRSRPGRRGRGRARARAACDPHLARSAPRRVRPGRRRAARLGAASAVSGLGLLARARCAGRRPAARRRRGGTAAWACRGSSASAMAAPPAIMQRAAATAVELARQVACPCRASAVDRVTMRPVETEMQQGGDLGDQAVADGQQGVGVRAASPIAMPRWSMPIDEAADEVDDGDDDAGDGVALDELRGAVHRAVEVGLGGDLGAARAGLVLVDQPGVEVGVDRHLLAGHGVEGEAGADLGDAARRRW